MELKQAHQIVCDMMPADPKYRTLWQIGISDAFNEEYAAFRAAQKKTYVNDKHFAVIADRAAKRFLETLTSMTQI